MCQNGDATPSQSPIHIQHSTSSEVNSHVILDNCEIIENDNKSNRNNREGLFCTKKFSRIKKGPKPAS